MTAPAISFMNPKVPTCAFQYEISVHIISNRQLSDTCCCHGQAIDRQRLTVGLDLNERHSRVLGSTSVHTITQVPKPRRRSLAVDLLDARVRVAGRGRASSHTDPVLCATVLERQSHYLVLLEVVELLAVRVG